VLTNGTKCISHFLNFVERYWILEAINLNLLSILKLLNSVSITDELIGATTIALGLTAIMIATVNSFPSVLALIFFAPSAFYRFLC